MSERQKVAIALVASVLLHIVIMIAFGIMVWIQPQSNASVPEQKPLEVTLFTKPAPKPRGETETAPVSPPAPELAKPKPTPKMHVLQDLDESDGLAKAEKPPANPLFSSSKNSVAGSELPPTGSAPLPSQEGKERPGV